MVLAAFSKTTGGQAGTRQASDIEMDYNVDPGASKLMASDMLLTVLRILCQI